MILTSGEIYFIGEVDVASGKQTDYVKIGIVRDGGNGERTTFDRLLEHQTGNPRRLEVIHVLKTDAVEAIETSLHHMFSPFRVYGEWLKVDGALLEEIKEKAFQLSQEMKHLRELFASAEDLKNIESIGEKIPPDVESLYWFEKYTDSSIKVDHCNSAIERYKRFRIEQISAGQNVEDFINVQRRSGKTKFDSKAFKEKYPEIYEQFVIRKPKIRGSFRPTASDKSTKTLMEVDLQAHRVIEDLLSKIESPGNMHNAAEIHDAFLSVKSQLAFAEWETNVSLVQLRILCGTNDGIDGICSWKRTAYVDEKLDEKSLKDTYPDLVIEFTTMTEETTAYILENKVAQRTLEN